MGGRIGPLLLKGFLALCAAGLAVGLLVPMLGRQGVAPPEWLVLPAVVVFVAVIVWPDVRALRRARK